jgi:hypothetical protein
MMGVIGALRLQQVVNVVDYTILCGLVVSGGTNLITPIHFAGNIPKEGRMLITSLKFSFAAHMTPIERKILRKNAISLQLFGISSKPIRLLKHNAIYLYFGGLINFIITYLVAHPDLGKVS